MRPFVIDTERPEVYKAPPGSAGSAWGPNKSEFFTWRLLRNVGRCKQPPRMRRLMTTSVGFLITSRNNRREIRKRSAESFNSKRGQISGTYINREFSATYACVERSLFVKLVRTAFDTAAIGTE